MRGAFRSPRCPPCPSWRRHLGALLCILAAGLAAAACAREGMPLTDLGGDLGQLRVAFNQDVNEVRAVLLASPT